jgi:FKBP-type peptidyl-prolyl cis-trans isomerase
VIAKNGIKIHKNTFLIFILFLAFFACNNQGFETAQNGLRFKFHTHHPQNQKVKKYDVVNVKMNYRTRDSLLYDGGNEIIPFQIDPYFEGDLMEGIMMMHLNDSATFIINTSDFFLKMMDYDQIPEHAQGSDELFFDIKLVEIRPETKALKAKRLEIENRKKSEQAKIEAYISSEKILEKPTNSGLYIIITREGDGKEAINNKKVKVHYTGFLLDGTVFDSSSERGIPASFTLGFGEVISAWDEAIPGMKQGTRARIITPSAMAYGEKSRNGVEPYSPLIFDIEIIEVE